MLPNVCDEGACVSPPLDAGFDASLDDVGELDAGADTPMPVDVGADLGVDAGHCGDGLLSAGESDVDCGGDCAPCRGCAACVLGTDCVGGA